MKTFISFLVLFYSLVFAQQSSVTPDPRLYEVLPETEITQLLKTNPYAIQYYNFFLDNSYKIVEQPQGQTLNLPSVTIPDLTKFNALLLKKEQKLERLWDRPTHYQIAGTSKIFVFLSEREFTEKLNKHIEKQRS